MATYTVELFGLPNDLAGRRNVEVELEDEADLTDIVAALRRELPALEGRIIQPDEDRLARHYSFNVNGRFHFEDYHVKVHPSDHILILTFALGG
jgi:hypothetical protein